MKTIHIKLIDIRRQLYWVDGDGLPPLMTAEQLERLSNVQTALHPDAIKAQQEANHAR